MKTFPFHDPNRIYTDEHDVNVHGCGITPSGHTFVSLYDIPQRRWYELNIDRPMPLEQYEEWFEQTLLHQIALHDSFNVINIVEGHVTCSVGSKVGRPLRLPIVASAFLPFANYTDITHKKYLRLSADTCTWNGLDCVYKQLEFDEYIGRLQRDIVSREKLLNHFGRDAPLSEYGICPILAIVVDGTPSFLCGILMPNAGVVLDQLPTGQLKMEHLVSLIKTLAHLRSAHVIHGDICERNVCLDGSSILLIDFGEVAPRYANDIVATGTLIQWCMKQFSAVERERLARAASELIDREDIEAALTILAD
jgi:tRNA A-37 threonylcarbamoyl transferase component Bud32